MEPPGRQLASVQTKSQTEILDLISADIELGFAFVAAAKAAANAREAITNLKKAQEALDAVRLFSGRIQDPEAWKEVHLRGNQLENAIRAFPHS